MTQERKNYYDILGVDKSATKADIRKKFRELSLKYHPDKQNGKSDKEKKEAEDKFKDINEAYSVLSDDKKRAEYDNPQPTDEWVNMGGSTVDEMMREFMRANGFNMGRHSDDEPRDIKIRIDITIDEAFNGCEKEVRIPITKVCSHCHGSGGEDKDSVVTCPKCGGTGSEFFSNGAFQQISTCRHCHGRGKIIKKPCHVCGGSGHETEYKTYKIKIERGTLDGMTYMLRGIGNEGKNGKKGNVLCVVNIYETRGFEINNEDLGIAVEITPIDAILGCEKEIETIEHKKLKIKIKPNTEQGTTMRLGGYGLYRANSKTKRGDLYCMINYKMPTSLNDHEKELLKALQEEEHFKSE